MGITISAGSHFDKIANPTNIPVNTEYKYDDFFIPMTETQIANVMKNNNAKSTWSVLALPEPISKTKPLIANKKAEIRPTFLLNNSLPRE